MILKSFFYHENKLFLKDQNITGSFHFLLVLNIKGITYSNHKKFDFFIITETKNYSTKIEVFIETFSECIYLWFKAN